jgi:transposase-like protein
MKLIKPYNGILLSCEGSKLFIEIELQMSCPEIVLQTKKKKSKTKGNKTYRRYSICFKKKVVQDVSEGSSVSEVCRRYGIKSTNTVRNWIRHYGREELLNKTLRIEMKGERGLLKELEEDIKRLKIALAEKTLALNAMIEKANRGITERIKK